jgi:GTP-binding protein
VTSPLRDLPVEFIGSFPDPRTPLAPILPEIALLGRSNVGKSSLLNAVTGRQGLARVSHTPGRTTAMNVFRFPEFYLVDLPGYGYARASKTEREGFARLLEGYLRRRTTLSGVVWLLDIRHAPSEQDLAQREVLALREVPVLVALTKADKLGRAAQRDQLAAIAARLEMPASLFHLTSSRTGQGIADLGESLLSAVREAA